MNSPVPDCGKVCHLTPERALSQLLNTLIKFEHVTDSVHLKLMPFFDANPKAQRQLQAQYHKGLREYGVPLNPHSKIQLETMTDEALAELIDALCYLVVQNNQSPSPKLAVAIGKVMDAINLLG